MVLYLYLFYACFMKKIFFTISFLFTAMVCLGQSQIKSNVLLSIKADTLTTPIIQSKCVFVMLPGTQELRGSIELFPIVPDPDKEDSLRHQRVPLILNINARFPLNDFDFLSVADNGKSFSLRATASLSDSIQTIPFNIVVIVLKNPSSPASNVAAYNARINFNFLIYPWEFGVNDFPFHIRNPIVLQGNNVVINKRA